MPKQPGFFDADERLKALSAAGDPLERLRAVVNFELFRAELEAALARGDRIRTRLCSVHIPSLNHVQAIRGIRTGDFPKGLSLRGVEARCA